MQYIEIAKTAATGRPASCAAFCIMVVATMPPESGGRPVMTRVLSMRSGQTNQASEHMPKRPARQMITVFHCSRRRLREKSVPI